MRVGELRKALRKCKKDDAVGIGVYLGKDEWHTQPVGDVVTGPGIALIRSGGDEYQVRPVAPLCFCGNPACIRIPATNRPSA